MRKLLNNPWFVALLALAALGAVWYSIAPYLGSPAGAGGPPPPGDAAPVQADDSSGDSVPSVAEALREAGPSKAGRNPFAVKAAEKSAQAAAPATAEPAVPDVVETVHLSALWTQNGATLAFINDAIRRVGDRVGTMKIASASSRGVWLSHAKGRTFLEVGNTFVLKTPGRPASKSPSPSSP